MVMRLQGIGTVGPIRRGTRRSIPRAPEWVLDAEGIVSSLDIDFVNDRGWVGAEVSISSLLTCTRASSGYYTNAAGVLSSFSSNVLRYGTNGLLVEEARTNLAIRSQEFDNASWSKSQATVSANAANAPDGTATADKLVEDGTTNAHTLQSAAITVSNATVYTASLYVKAAGRTFVQFQWFDGTTNVYPIFNLTTGTKDTDNGVGSGWTMTALANDWWRITITFTTGNTSGSIYVYPAVTGNNSYAGDGSSGIYAWGAQLEAGAFATSYIPTTTTSVARAADIVYMLTSAITGFSATAGTMYLKASAAETEPASNFYLGLHDNSGSVFNCFRQQTFGSIGAETNTSVSLHFATPSDGETAESALAWAENDFAGCANGGAVQTDASAAVPAVTHLQLGGGIVVSGFGHWNGYIPRFAYWNTRLANATLQALTA
jgi:hypothetical protein